MKRQTYGTYRGDNRRRPVQSRAARTRPVRVRTARPGSGWARRRRPRRPLVRLRVDTQRLRRLGLWLLLLVAAGLLGGTGYLWTRAALLPRLVRVIEARPGRLETIVPARAAVMRDEWVLTAPAAGAVKVLVEEGQRVRTGTPLCLVNETTITAPAPGVVSLVVDGTEGRLRPEAGRSPAAAEVLGLQPQPRQLKDGQLVTAGQTLLRVVDNRETRLAVALPPAEIAPLTEEVHVTVRFPEWPGTELELRPVAFTPGDDRSYGTITLVGRDWLEQMARARVVDVEVIKECYTGLIVPRRCLVERNGVKGLYVVKKTLAQWVMVEIKGEKGSQVAVAGIPEGSQVITNPWLVREGAIVR